MGTIRFLSGETILEWKEALVEGRNCFLNTGGNADVKFYVGGAAYSTDTWCISARDKIPRIKLVDCKNIDYLKQSGVYFLVSCPYFSDSFLIDYTENAM